MNRELILKLIERAQSSAGNAYCPYTNAPVGCSLLVDDNIIFGGCNVENNVLSCSACAGEVAVLKAISEGYTTFRAVCFWMSGMTRLPYPSGKTLQIFSEFSSTKKLNIICANERTYETFALGDLLPCPPENTVIE